MGECDSKMIPSRLLERCMTNLLDDNNTVHGRTDREGRWRRDGQDDDDGMGDRQMMTMTTTADGRTDGRTNGRTEDDNGSDARTHGQRTIHLLVYNYIPFVPIYICTLYMPLYAFKYMYTPCLLTYIPIIHTYIPSIHMYINLYIIYRKIHVHIYIYICIYKNKQSSINRKYVIPIFESLKIKYSST